MDEPIKELDSIIDKIIYIFKKIFKTQKHKNDDLSFSPKYIEVDTTKSAQYAVEAMQKVGVSFDEASHALRMLAYAVPPNLLRESYNLPPKR